MARGNEKEEKKGGAIHLHYFLALPFLFLALCLLLLLIVFFFGDIYGKARRVRHSALFLQFRFAFGFYTVTQHARNKRTPITAAIACLDYQAWGLWEGRKGMKKEGEGVHKLRLLVFLLGGNGMDGWEAGWGREGILVMNLGGCVVMIILYHKNQSRGKT